MMFKTLLRTSAICAVAFSVTAANAQMLTFTTKDDEGRKELGTTSPEGVPVMGAYWTGAASSTWADGKKTKETYSCVSTTQPPRDAVFAVHLICDSVGPDGAFTSTWGCNPLNAGGTEMGCVGGFYGKSGSYAGKRGSATFHGKADGAGKGAGQWYE